MNRQKYGLTERDQKSSLDHTWFRKYENLSGRWTSPDPLGGNLGDPQSFNRYAYVGNDPLNFVDPSGLDPSYGFSVYYPPGFLERLFGTSASGTIAGVGGIFGDDFHFEIELGDPEVGGGGATGEPQPDNQELCDGLRQLINDIINRVRGPEGGLKGLRYRYQEQINGANGPGTTKWQTHEKEYNKQRRQLGRALQKWFGNDCGKGPPGADAWANKPAPSPKQWFNAHRPPAAQSSSVPWGKVAVAGGVVVVAVVVVVVVISCPPCGLVFAVP